MKIVSSIPDQIKRLIVVVVLMVGGFLIARTFFVPKTFGEYGHYRASAVDSAAIVGISYAGHQICAECHDDVAVLKKNSHHRTVNCESCHGPCAAHVESVGEVKPLMPRERGYCALCHIYNPAKPTGFPQIDLVAHNPGKQCITCHNPHAPEPPSTPGECSACHAGINRTKALSPHAPLACIECHVTPEEHKINPRAARPGKPQNRSDCGKCHDKSADSDRFIPRIDVATHNEGYLCWQCHYPHSPETK